MQDVISDSEKNPTVSSVGLLYRGLLPLPIQLDDLLILYNRLPFCKFAHIASSSLFLKVPSIMPVGIFRIFSHTLRNFLKNFAKAVVSAP